MGGDLIVGAQVDADAHRVQGLGQRGQHRELHALELRDSNADGDEPRHACVVVARLLLAGTSMRNSSPANKPSGTVTSKDWPSCSIWIGSPARLPAGHVTDTVSTSAGGGGAAPGLKQRTNSDVGALSACRISFAHSGGSAVVAAHFSCPVHQCS